MGQQKYSDGFWLKGFHTDCSVARGIIVLCQEQRWDSKGTLMAAGWKAFTQIALVQRASLMVCLPSKNSATRTRTRVARVRAEYPNQLDYSGC